MFASSLSAPLPTFSPSLPLDAARQSAPAPSANQTTRTGVRRRVSYLQPQRRVRGRYAPLD